MINCAYINKLMINTQDYFNNNHKRKEEKISNFWSILIEKPL